MCCINPTLLRWPNCRNRVNLPTSSSPIVRTTRIRVLRRVTVLFVEHHPANHSNLAAQESLPQVGSGPVLSFRSHNRPPPWSYFDNHVMYALRIAQVKG